MRLVWVVVLLNFAAVGHAQEVSLTMLQEGRPTSIRGLSVVDDDVAWVSGSHGWVGHTADRGDTWDWKQVIGFETIDFRDIEAFSATEAVMISAGSPLVILRTEDGGHTWQETHRDERPDIFFDGMDFWDDRRGIAYGDPIDGMMQLLQTVDGGATWQSLTQDAHIQLMDGEAGFAASGTGIRTLGNGNVFIATGGSRARLFHSTDYGLTWSVTDCPIVHGVASTGIFSIAFQRDGRGVAVGGDYQQDKQTTDAVFLTADGGITWTSPPQGTHGYRSAVEYLSADTLVASGTSGVDISVDGGLHWQVLSIASFHAVRKAKQGTWVLLAGANGRVASLSRN